MSDLEQSVSDTGSYAVASLTQILEQAKAFPSRKGQRNS
jgi:hypothetical protein